MKTKFKLAVLALFCSTINSQFSTSVAQGVLTPSGAPAPTMKTLQQVEPRIPISTIPISLLQPGSYYLTGNVTGTAGNHGIIISASDVTLDLGGFAVVGVPGALNGISISTATTNVTVRNGAVRGWPALGVDNPSSFSRNTVFEHLNISGSGSRGLRIYFGLVADCTINGTVGGNGIEAYNSEVRGCTVTGCSQNGIVGTTSIIRNCTVANSSAVGIFATACRVENCFVDASGSYGMILVPGTVTGCTVQNSVQNGIYVNLPGSQVIGNTIQNNNTGNSAAFAGIFVNDARNRVENNHLEGNGSAGFGIYVSSSYPGNVIIRNTVYGHGANNYSTGGNQVVGPLITTFGTIASVNPWANFSF